MSYSTLYAVYKTTATGIREYRNGWGSGPAIWDYLSRKHLGLNGWAFSADRGLWDLAVDEKVPLALRACHALTFDYAVVPRDKLKEMAALIAEAGKILGEFSPETVNHFPAIAADLASVKLNRRAMGVGLNCTSVSDTWGQDRRYWKAPFDCYAYVTKAGATP